MGLSGPTLEVQCVLLVSYYDKIFKIIHEVGVFLWEEKGRGKHRNPTNKEAVPVNNSVWDEAPFTAAQPSAESPLHPRVVSSLLTTWLAVGKTSSWETFSSACCFWVGAFSFFPYYGHYGPWIITTRHDPGDEPACKAAKETFWVQFFLFFFCEERK